MDALGTGGASGVNPPESVRSQESVPESSQIRPESNPNRPESKGGGFSVVFLLKGPETRPESNRNRPESNRRPVRSQPDSVRSQPESVRSQATGPSGVKP